MTRSQSPGAERVVIADLLTAGQGLIDFKDKLLAHHRAGSPPSEAWWRRYDEAKRRWAAAVEAAQSGERARSAD